MLRTIRKKLASSVVKTETPEQFLWDKWLRSPYLDYETITSPKVELYNTDDFNDWLNLPEYFRIKIEPLKVRVSKKINKSSTTKPKTHKIFFGFGNIASQEIRLTDKDKLKIDFILSFIREGSELYLKSKRKEHKENVESLNPDVFSPSFRINKSKTGKLIPKLSKPEFLHFECRLYIPQITDQLLQVFPEIYNIELLSDQEIKSSDFLDKHILISFEPLSDLPLVKQIKILKSEELISELSKSASYKKNYEVPLNLINKNPKIYKVKITKVDKAKIPIYFLKNVQAKTLGISKRDFLPLRMPELIKSDFQFPDKLNSELPAGKENLIKNKDQTSSIPVQDSIESILQPSVDLDDSDKAKLFQSLYIFQKEGAQFLSAKKSALLSDELGLGKTIQAITALRILFKTREIKSGLIVAPSYDLGYPELREKVPSTRGWEGELNKWAAELSVNIINENEDNDKKWTQQSHLYLTSYSQLLNDLKKDKLSKERIKKFDCIVFDEVQFLLNKNFNIGKLLEGIDTKYLLALSSIPHEEIIESLKSVFNHINSTNEENLAILRRTKSEVKNDQPNLIRQEYWIPMDDDQKIEYENTLSHGKEKISQLIQAGNPFLIQSNIFTLLHQLKQVCNFSSHSETSPKTELLLKHVELIEKNHQKVLIFTQYDRLGIQKLEQVFKKNAINYLVYQTGMSLKEMENALKNFKKNEGVTALLVSLKAAGAKLDLKDIPYIIHFDQWWNPITLWQTEEKVSYSENGNSGLNDYSSDGLTIYSYLTKGTIEEKIKEKLSLKGLLEKNIIETLPPEAIYEFINNDEWLDILNLTKLKKNNNLQKAIDKMTSLSTDELGEKTKLFLTRLGYKNIMMKPALSNGGFDLTGSIIKNNKEVKMSLKCFASKINDNNAVEDILKNNEKNDRKFFFINTSKLDGEINFDQQENISFINRETFARYLMQFKLI